MEKFEWKKWYERKQTERKRKGNKNTHVVYGSKPKTASPVKRRDGSLYMLLKRRITTRVV
jgi:hypothetical protein